ncbi:contact-dependent growth inhibition system immunity protein [Nocardioides taihuensis]|uniref:Contact-dependent growth inhibition system immunity protein n=1 Tax=Nocardioides taihuensis TaxID=1835606 RepID=A0ABW0BKN9_9ACTN
MTSPGVGHLMGAYFHQDYALDCGDDLGAADAFVADEPEMSESLVSDIVETLKMYRTSGEMKEYLLQQGCAYYPSRFDGDYVAWLAALRDHVLQADHPHGPQ